MTPELLTVPEFCRSVNIGQTRFYQLLNGGTINAVKLGKKTLIKREELENFISSLNSYNQKAAEGK